MNKMGTDASKSLKNRIENPYIHCGRIANGFLFGRRPFQNNYPGTYVVSLEGCLPGEDNLHLTCAVERNRLEAMASRRML